MCMSKRQQQKEETKNRIVEVAYKIYSQNGFSATTADIAKVAKVSHGTIFAHFNTLNELLIYLINDFGDKLGRRLHELAENSHNIKEVLEAHLNVIEEYEDFYKRFISETSLLPIEVRNIFVVIQSTLSFHFNKVLEKEILKEKIKNIPTSMIFNTWVGLLHYYLQNSDLFSPNESVIKRYRDDLIDSFLKLIYI